MSFVSVPALSNVLFCFAASLPLGRPKETVSARHRADDTTSKQLVSDHGIYHLELDYNVQLVYRTTRCTHSFIVGLLLPFLLVKL